VRARDLSLSVMSRGEALASILDDCRSIVVAGTHGKTTTTSMIITILRSAGLDPTYLVGGELNDAGTNARTGTGPYAVAESDESDGSFLLLRPSIAVITNVEADHLDYWGSLAAIRSAFENFIGNTEPSGHLVVPAGDEVVRGYAQSSGRQFTTFDDDDGRIRAADITYDATGSRFLVVDGDESHEAALSVPGRHNISNALAAVAAAVAAGLDAAAAARGLAAYRGVGRRFQVRGRAAGVTVVDDYAHHPSEVAAILAAARSGPWERIVAVFQPHRYTRTAALWREFGLSFRNADNVVVTDVYGAGEEPVPGVSGKLVAESVGATLRGRPLAYLPHRGELLAYLMQLVRPGDAVLTLGAGDVTSVGEELIARLEATR
jgi:UDP-N-acetylmuramate--alanine ligase